ncbi:MAG: hypothetical protein IT353_00785 [Gemmatimonadaceae bacterium]|nr:hypothetical protein [Gemmatimonadaceae bacterium]
MTPVSQPPRATPQHAMPSSPSPRASAAVAWPVVWDRVTMALVLASAAILVWPAPRATLPARTVDPASRDSASQEAVRTVPPSPMAVVDSLVAIAIRGNVFSATREAPRVAFVMPGQTLAMQMTDAGVADSVLALGTVERDSFPRLSGIVSTAGERRALMQLNAREGAPHLYRVGEGASGFRVLRIGADAVVLTSRAGTRTLRLASPPSPDSTGTSP